MAILFSFIDYFIMGERILVFSIIAGIIFSALMTFFFRIYAGSDTGGMFFELIDTFDSNKPHKEILQILTELIQAKNGKILSCSENSLKARVGSKIMSRLFGAGFISMNQLPIRIEVNIELVENKNYIIAHFFDDEPKFVIKGQWEQSTFNQYFKEFSKEIKEKLIEH